MYNFVVFFVCFNLIIIIFCIILLILALIFKYRKANFENTKIANKVIVISIAALVISTMAFEYSNKELSLLNTRKDLNEQMERNEK